MRPLSSRPGLRLALLVSLAAAVGACGDATSADEAFPTITYDSEATSTAELTERMVARWEQRFAGVDSFVVEAGGLQLTYSATPDSVRRAENGLWFYIAPAVLGTAQPSAAAAELLERQIPNVPGIARDFAEGTFGGVQTLGGRRGYVLAVEDSVAAGETGTPADEAMVQTRRLLVDAETYDVLEVLTTSRVASVERPITQRLVYEDFRTESGLPIPYVVRSTEEGMEQYVTEDSRMILGGQLGMQKQRLEAEPSSPERDARLEYVNGELAVLDGQPRTADLTIDRVEVFGRR